MASVDRTEIVAGNSRKLNSHLDGFKWNVLIAKLRLSSAFLSNPKGHDVETYRLKLNSNGYTPDEQDWLDDQT